MRRIALLAVFGLTLAKASAVYALGLGEINLKSGLNQPLNAQIELLSVRKGETEGMLVSLASQDAFLRSNVERPFFLTQLQFKIELKPNGMPYVQVSSRKPIVEPFLNFLVEIDWPRGRLLKEYTLLLDPPVFMTDMARTDTTTAPFINDAPGFGAAVPAPILRDGQGGSPLSQADGSDSMPADPFAQQPDVFAADEIAETNQPLGFADGPPGTAGSAFESDGAMALDAEASVFGSPLARADAELELYPRAGTSSDGMIPLADLDVEAIPGLAAGTEPEPQVENYDTDYGPVKANENLWNIANEVKPGAATINQMMIALLRYNPEAFIDGNINYLRKGAILRIPEKQTVTGVSRAQANSEVMAQNAIWQQLRFATAGSRGVSPAASQPAPPGVAVSQASESQLALLAVDESQASAGQTAANKNLEQKSQALQQELSLAREEIASERLQNDELRTRVGELESIIDNTERMFELQQAELAKLQAQLEAQTGNTLASEPAPVSSLPLIETPVVETPVVESPAATPAPAPSVSMPSPVPQSTDLMQQLKDTANKLLADLMAGRILQNPLLMGVLGGIAVILLLLIMAAKKKRGSQDSDDLGLLDDLDGQLDLGSDDEIERMLAETSVDDGMDLGDLDDDILADLGTDDMAASTTSSSAQKTSNMLASDVDAESDLSEGPKDDTLAEADVYLAYGLFSQAEDLLKQGLREQPDNKDYHLKLLENYFAAADKTGFASNAVAFKQLIGDGASPQWDKVVAMGGELCPEDPLFSGAGDLNISVAQPVKPKTTDLDLDSDEITPDLDFGMGDDDVQVITGADFDTGEVPAIGDDLGLDDYDATQTVAGFQEDILDMATASHTEELSSLATGTSKTVEMEGLEFDLSSTDMHAIDEAASAYDETDDVGVGGSSDNLDMTVEDMSMLQTDEVPEEVDAAVEAAADNMSLEFDMDASLTGLESTEGDLPGGDFDMSGTAELPTMDDGLDDFDLQLEGVDSTMTDDEPSLVSRLVTAVSDDMLAGSTAEQARVVSQIVPSVTDAMLDQTMVQDAGSFQGDELDLDGGDEVETMLDLAKAYLDMGDSESASSALEEIIAAGNQRQKQEAQQLLGKISA